MNHDEVIALCVRAREAAPGLADAILAFDEVSIDCPASELIAAATWLRDQGPFELLADHSAIDWLGHEPSDRRFCVSVQLASVGHAGRVRLRVWLPEHEPRCPSLTGVWTGANAMEREMFDLFGIAFDGHPNLTRIFMPDEWVGHPQRKDEPLGGIDVRYEHGQAVTPPDDRAVRPASTSGYPGRTS